MRLMTNMDIISNSGYASNSTRKITIDLRSLEVS